MAGAYSTDGVVETWSRISCSANHSWGAFPDPGGGGVYADQKVLIGALTRGVFQGAGSPNSVLAASIGSLYLRTDGGASTTLYVKESGSGNTGWVAK